MAGTSPAMTSCGEKRVVKYLVFAPSARADAAQVSTRSDRPPIKKRCRHCELAKRSRVPRRAVCGFALSPRKISSCRPWIASQARDAGVSLAPAQAPKGGGLGTTPVFAMTVAGGFKRLMNFAAPPPLPLSKQSWRFYFGRRLRFRASTSPRGKRRRVRSRPKAQTRRGRVSKARRAEGARRNASMGVQLRSERDYCLICGQPRVQRSDHHGGLPLVLGDGRAIYRLGNCPVGRADATRRRRLPTRNVGGHPYPLWRKLCARCRFGVPIRSAAVTRALCVQTTQVRPRSPCSGVKIWRGAGARPARKTELPLLRRARDWFSLRDLSGGLRRRRFRCRLRQARRIAAREANETRASGAMHSAVDNV